MTTEPAPETAAIAPSATVSARVYDIANILLVVSLVVGVIATALVVWMGAVKETYSREEIAELGLKTAEANERAAKANEAAATANEAAERERVARLKLEARLADRVLPAEAQAELQKVAASFPKGTRLDIGTFGSAVEVLNLAQSINRALAVGGWTVRQWSISGGAAVRGIVVGSDPTKAATANADARLVAVFAAFGIGAGTFPFKDMPEGGMRLGPSEPMDAPIRMFIGSK